MGFSYHAITLPKLLTSFFSILTYAAGFPFRPLRHTPEEAPEQDSDSSDYILLFDGCSPSLIPIPVAVVKASIKARVPVLQYGEFLRRRGMDESETEKACRCSICLEEVKWREEIREPCACGQVFHRACLDGWIDVGKVNCPLCRTMLLPPKTNLFRCMREYSDRTLSSPN